MKFIAGLNTKHHWTTTKDTTVGHMDIYQFHMLYLTTNIKSRYICNFCESSLISDPAFLKSE
jgi:hypothetical protein